MVNVDAFLQALGLSVKEQQVYADLLRQGPSSVAQIALRTDINRGTTYDVIKSLLERGLVSQFDQGKKTFFAAANPETFHHLVSERQVNAQALAEQVGDVVSQLQSMAQQGGAQKPVARYFSGAKAIRQILLEVLDDVSELPEKTYFVYSSASIARHLYEAIPDFTKRRIKAGIRVSVIALGNGGTNHEELAERRWLTRETPAPTYTIIYGRKTAFISLDAQEQAQGVIIEDPNLADTQRLLFLALWKFLNMPLRGKIYAGDCAGGR